MQLPHPEVQAEAEAQGAEEEGKGGHHKAEKDSKDNKEQLKVLALKLLVNIYLLNVIFLLIILVLQTNDVKTIFKNQISIPFEIKMRTKYIKFKLIFD